jgi:uncharacterized membrane protein YsdA (DUF1294 family)
MLALTFTETSRERQGSDHHASEVAGPESTSVRPLSRTLTRRLRYAPMVRSKNTMLLPLLIALAWLLIASIITLALFGIDKRAATLGRRRIRERTLNLWALAGGWPGALLGQRFFRHKTIDRWFRVALWAAIAGNLLALGVILWACWNLTGPAAPLAPAATVGG